MKKVAEKMEPYRKRIDDLDDQIIDLLSIRTDIIREVAQFKYENDIPAFIEERVNEVRERAASRAGNKNIDEKTIRLIYQILIDYSCKLEEEIKKTIDQNDRQAVGS